MYADGWISQSKSKGSPVQFGYAGINREFLEELQLLFNNLGLQTSLRKLHDAGKQLMPDGKGGQKLYGCKDSWRLVGGSKNNALVLERHTGLLSRKGIEIEDRLYNDNTKKAYAIESIERVGKENVYCPTVETDEHVFVAQGMITFNCSEIALPSSPTESFVCCLSSMNALHFDRWKDTDAVRVLTFFLDAVMEEFIQKTDGMDFMERAVRFSKRHRALGIGVLGWHSLLQCLSLPFDSFEAMQKNAAVFKHIREESDRASEELADRFGEPEVLEGYERRNTTTMAVAPTKSSSFILGQVSQGIEPERANYYVRDTAKLKHTHKNPFLQERLREIGRDTEDVWDSIRMQGGSVQHLDFLSDHDKDVFKTFFEISQMAIVKQAAQRQQWIDQSQSLNLAVNPQEVSVKEVNKLHVDAWQSGVKTLYYMHNVNSAATLGRQKRQDFLDCRSCEG